MRQPCRSCASSNNTGFCPGRKFFAQGHFVQRKALPKRHCLLLLSREHVQHSKIHFRNPSVLQPRWPFGCCSGSKKGSPEKKMWHRMHRREESLSVLNSTPLHFRHPNLPCVPICRLSGATFLGSVQARNFSQGSLSLLNVQKDIMS